MFMPLRQGPQIHNHSPCNNGLLIGLRHGIAKIIQDCMNSLDDEFGESIRENPKISLLLASMVGFLLEDRIL